jgi:hypothetical protein
MVEVVLAPTQVALERLVEVAVQQPERRVVEVALAVDQLALMQ